MYHVLWKFLQITSKYYKNIEGIYSALSIYRHQVIRQLAKPPFLPWYRFDTTSNTNQLHIFASVTKYFNINGKKINYLPKEMFSICDEPQFFIVKENLSEGKW